MQVAVTGGTGFVGVRLIRRLLAEGHTVLAPARTASAAARLRAMGATPVPALAALGSAEVVFQTTRSALPRHPRLVLLSSDAAVQHGRPLVNATEELPLRPHSPSPVAAAQARAESAALARGAVIVRPRLLWGAGDPALPRLWAAVRAGRFSWVGGGSQLTDTTHVDNAVHALLLAARHGRPGETYFVTDQDPVAYRHFIADLLAADGLTAPARTVSYRRAHTLTTLSEAAWRALRLPGSPPLDYLTLWRAGLECTVDTRKARAQLGYEPVRSRGQGLAELRDALSCNA